MRALSKSLIILLFFSIHLLESIGLNKLIPTKNRIASFAKNHFIKILFLLPIIPAAYFIKQRWFKNSTPKFNFVSYSGEKFSPNQSDCNLSDRCGIYALGNWLTINKVYLDGARPNPADKVSHVEIAEKNIKKLLEVFPGVVNDMIAHPNLYRKPEYPLEPQKTNAYIEAECLMQLFTQLFLRNVNLEILSVEALRSQAKDYLSFQRNPYEERWKASQSFFPDLSGNKKASCLLNLNNTHWVCLDIDLYRQKPDWIIVRDSLGRSGSFASGAFTGRGRLEASCQQALMELLEYIHNGMKSQETVD